MTNEARAEPHFAAFCEIQDAAAATTLDQAIAAPAAAAIEFAKILQRFDGQIDDEWRELLVAVAGGVSRLDTLIQAADLAAEIRRHG